MNSSTRFLFFSLLTFALSACSPSKAFVVNRADADHLPLETLFEKMPAFQSEEEKKLIRNVITEMSRYLQQVDGSLKWNLFLEQMQRKDARISEGIYAVYGKTTGELLEEMYLNSEDPVGIKGREILLSTEEGMFEIKYVAGSQAEKDMVSIKSILRMYQTSLTPAFFSDTNVQDGPQQRLSSLTDNKIQIVLAPNRRFYRSLGGDDVDRLHPYQMDFLCSKTGARNKLTVRGLIKYSGLFSLFPSMNDVLCEIFMALAQTNPAQTATTGCPALSWQWVTPLWQGFKAFRDEESGFLYRYGIFGDPAVAVRTYWKAHGRGFDPLEVLELGQLLFKDLKFMTPGRRQFYLAACHAFTRYAIETWGEPTYMKLLVSRRLDVDFMNLLKKNRKTVSRQWLDRLMKDNERR